MFMLLLLLFIIIKMFICSYLNKVITSKCFMNKSSHYTMLIKCAHFLFSSIYDNDQQHEIWCLYSLCVCLQEWQLSWPWPHWVSVPGTLSLKWPMPQLWIGSLLSAMPLSSQPSLSLQQSTTSPRGVTLGMEKVWCQRRYLTLFKNGLTYLKCAFIIIKTFF